MSQTQDAEGQSGITTSVKVEGSDVGWGKWTKNNWRTAIRSRGVQRQLLCFSSLNAPLVAIPSSSLVTMTCWSIDFPFTSVQQPSLAESVGRPAPLRRGQLCRGYSIVVRFPSSPTAAAADETWRQAIDARRLERDAGWSSRSSGR